MKSHLITVLLPFAGHCPRLHQAILSVLEDGCEDFELLLIDNGADPSSLKTAQKMMLADKRIRLIPEPQPGIAHALNTGLRHSKGEFIARMDADDISLPGRFEMQSNYLTDHPQTGLVSGLVSFSGDRQQGSGFISYIDQINGMKSFEEIFRYRFLESPFAHPSVMFRRSLIADVGTYTNDPAIPEDYELWLRWLDNGVHMEKIPAEVLIWHDSPERLTRTGPAYTRAAFDSVRMKYLTLWMESSGMTSSHDIWVWGAGKFGRRKAKSLMNAGFPVQGFIDVNPALGSVSIDDQLLPVTHYLNLPPPGKMFIVSFVSNRGKPFEIERFLVSKGYRNGVDFVLSG